MKKLIVTTLLIVCALISTDAQTFNTAEYLDINKVKARYMVHGDMFWNPDSNTAAYEFPKGSGIHSNFASGLWIGGVERSTNTLKVAVQRYRTNGNDYWPGPLDEFNGALIDSATAAHWAQIWKVNRSTIDSFKAITNHTLGNTPLSILHWPGRKNPHCKTPNNTSLNLPDREMAPYFDVNNDNIYNPLDGDYPVIMFSDQALFWVFNDMLNTKESGSGGMNLEIHAMAYAFNCPALNNVTFLDYTIHNWGTSIYDSTYVGIRCDLNLGYSFDNFFGYDTMARMGVVYNGDSFDEGIGATPNFPPIKGYDSMLTQHGVILVNGPRVDNPNYPATDPNPYLELEPSSFTYFNHIQGRTGYPNNTQEFYNYLTGSWKDGSRFVAGCNPEALTGSPYPFVFPEDPSLVSGISEPVCNKISGDRRMILSSGPFKLIPGSVPSRITLAFLNTNRGSDNSNFNALRIVADSARSQGCAYWPVSTSNVIVDNQIKVYPNPTSSFITVSSEIAITKLEVFDLLGNKVIETKELLIDIRSLSNGLYILKGHAEEGVKTFKVQVNR